MGRTKRAKGGQKGHDVPALHPCRVCGKRFGVTPSSRLSRKASHRIAKQKDVCSPCWLAEEAEAAAPKAQVLGLSELVGTPKQKQYALILRQEHVEAGLRQPQHDAARNEFLAQVSSQTDAKWWIDNSRRIRGSRGQGRFDPALVTDPVVQFDGGCTKNPGGVGTFGAVLMIDGQIKDAVCGRIGRGLTSNRAEYRGLIEGLRLAQKHLPAGSTLHVTGDSLLVIRQMRGDWKVLDNELLPLWQEAQRLSAEVGSVNYHSIPRGRNRQADHLTRAALNGCADALTALSKYSSAAPAPIAPSASTLVPDVSAFIVAVAAGGRGGRLAGGAVVWQGNVELASFSSPCSRNEKLSDVLRRLVENARNVVREMRPEGGSITLLSREETLIEAPPDFRGWICEVRRPAAGEEVRFQRAKSLARIAAGETRKQGVVPAAARASGDTGTAPPAPGPEAARNGVRAAPKDRARQEQKKAKRDRTQKQRKIGKKSLYPAESTVREFNRARETARALGLPRLMYGTEIQHENATSIRHNFILTKIRFIEELGLPNTQELKDRLLREVKKREFSKWWLDEKERLDQHFADVLPPAASSSPEAGPPSVHEKQSAPSAALEGTV